MIAFDTKLGFGAASFEAAIALLRDGIGELPWPRVLAIDSPMKTAPSAPNQAADLVDTLANPARWLNGSTFQLVLGKRSWLTMSYRNEAANGVVRLDTGDALFDEPAAYVSSPVWLVRALWKTGKLRVAHTRVSGDDELGCVPRVPIADVQTPIVLTSDAEIALSYDDPAQFLDGWKAERQGKQLLLARATTAVATADVMTAIRDHQWRMARAAKPGQTKYADPIVHPELEALFSYGASTLSLRGGDGEAELACTLAPGQHVPGFDVYQVREIVKRKQLADGTPVTGVRIVFAEREVALAEKRPLLDVGARVFAGDEELS